MSKDKQPEIRFPGFMDDWEQRKLKEISTYIRGSFPQPYTNLEFYDEKNGKPFVQVADIGFDLKLNSDTKAHISKLAEPKSRFVKAGKVVVALQGSIEKSIGRTAITQYDAYFDRTILIFEEYKIPIDKIYFAQIIKKLFEHEKEKAWGATISTITKAHLNDFIIGVPSIEEQQKIGTFFKQLDDTIALHQRKLDLLKETKKGFLQKMFPKNGAKVPEIRFPGFTEDWEERKLGGIGKTYTGLTGKSKEDFGHGDAKFVTYMNVFQNPKATLEQLENVEIDPRQNEVKKGDVFFTTSSETPEEVGMSSVWTHDINNIYLNSFTFAYRPTIKFDLDYLAFMLRSQSVRKKIIYLAQGISRYNISKTKMMDISVPIPVNFEEQQKIGAFFKQLDDIITLHQRKLDLLKETKKGFLQKMFV
ncbi:restriction endonuclease subunit S [Enterococcus hirae]|uniref:restriction endonuclease subunit S n=1 Tax=Enterococcus hirae TaxID=1354 RepID=UPI0021E913BA|nr:restriction endonuclease subunit S [Enterococcus hirae]MCV3097373.1 restriction endonuclease subunit S [Enterococcus hirae]MCV3124972.1 restriction endonuclease subunit S [Enterococcus hirae]